MFPALSVLDLSPVVAGSTARDALRNSVDLAQHADRWGYRRYWVAEHHGMPGIASSAPPVLIGHIAEATERIRVGSGGVMLPNHAPLVVAEQFGMLEALHPDRIDLGLGRAPGTDQLTAHALRRTLQGSDDEMTQLLGELLAFFRGTFPADHPYSRISAVPAEGFEPEVWLLGSSGYSAQLAGMLGLPFGFAHHFSAQNTLPALELYRSRFTPGKLDEPYLLIGVNVICAPTDEEAQALSLPFQLSMLRLRTGSPGQLPTVAEAAAYEWTAEERAVVEPMAGSAIIGSPETVRTKLTELAELTGVDEFIVTTNVPEHAARLASYEALSEIAALAVV